jgi:putative FmdB family regulatory protein
MPIYEYRVIEGQKGCCKCRNGIESIQDLTEDPLNVCPHCHAPVVRVLSTVNFQMADPRRNPVEGRIRDYEKKRMYSHAAELADKAAEKTKREDLKARAMENYKKAGYKDL